LGDFTFVQVGFTFHNLTKKTLIYCVSHWGLGAVFWDTRPTKAPRGDETGYQQTSVSKTVLPNHASWDIGRLDAQQ